MAAVLSISTQSLQVTDVGNVIITDPVQDEVYGDWLRDIRIYGTALVEGGTMPLIVGLRIRSADKENLEITAPAQSF